MPRPSYIYEGFHPPFHGWRSQLSLAFHLARREVNSRYQGSALGFLWSLLNPLMMMLVFTFVFRIVFRAEVPDVPYAAFFLTGYLMWNAFSLAVYQNVNVVGEYRLLIDTHRFPVWTLPASRVLAAFFSYILTLPILIIVNAVLGVFPGSNLLFLPVVLFLTLAFATGVGLLVACLTPFFKDLAHLIEIAMTILYFGSPILYPASFVRDMMPQWALLLYDINPMNGLVELLHWCFLGLEPPTFPVIMSVLLSLATLLIGFLVFMRRSEYFNQLT